MLTIGDCISKCIIYFYKASFLYSWPWFLEHSERHHSELCWYSIKLYFIWYLIELSITPVVRDTDKEKRYDFLSKT